MRNAAPRKGNRLRQDTEAPPACCNTFWFACATHVRSVTWGPGAWRAVGLSGNLP